MIHTLTVNTAIDKLLFIDAFNRDNTNRIRRKEEVLGGKGTHVSINLSILGEDSGCFGITQGETGTRILDILNARGNLDVRMLHYNDGESRTNYALIENDHTCSLITEKGKLVSKQRCEELLDTMQEHMKPGDYLVLSGDANNTEIPFFYNAIMQRLANKGVRFILDTSSRNLAEALKEKPYLVKPNVDELSQIMGYPIETEAQILEGLRFIANQGVEIVAVSCGGDGSYVLYQDVVYRVYPLKVNVINTIGCGDAYLTGLVYGLNKELPFLQTLQVATAISAATAESDLTVGFDLERAMSLRDQVKVEVMSNI